MLSGMSSLSTELDAAMSENDPNEWVVFWSRQRHQGVGLGDVDLGQDDGQVNNAHYARK